MAAYTIYLHPQTKVRFARLPDGRLVPNQGNAPYRTLEDIEANYQEWLRRSSETFEEFTARVEAELAARLAG